MSETGEIFTLTRREIRKWRLYKAKLKVLQVAHAHGVGRHAIPLNRLARDRDPRYRPSSELLQIIETRDGWPGMSSTIELDRPIVPLLNALVERGFTTFASCADQYVALEGQTEAEVQVLTAISRRFPGSLLDWSNGSPAGTTLRWNEADVTKSRIVDRALLNAAEDVRSMTITGGPLRDEARFMAEASAELQKIDPSKPWGMSVSVDLGAPWAWRIWVEVGAPTIPVAVIQRHSPSGPSATASRGIVLQL